MFDKLFGGDPQSQGSLAAIAQILQASGPSRTPRGLYQILGSGMTAGQEATQQAMQQAQAAQLRGLQIKGAESDLAQQQRAVEKQARIDDAFRSSYQSAGAQAASLPGGPTVENAARIGEFEGGFNSAGAIEKLWSIDPEYALKLQQSMKKVGPKFDSGITFVNGPDGKPMAVRTADDGSVKQVEGYLPREKLEFRDTGNAVLGVNPYTGERQASLAKGLSPDAAASNALGYANLNLSKQRLAMDKQAQSGGGRPPPGYRWGPNGSLEAIPGGPATKHAMASEGERKASTLLQRLQFSEAQLEAAVKDAPGAATPSLLAQGLRGVGAEAAANSLTGEARQKVDAAQMDILDAALTLGTGAAYTKEQLEGYRKSYFPQIGDAPGTVADKQARLNNVIEAAKTAAGRAAPAQPSLPTTAPPASGGWSIRKVQ